MVHHVGSQCPSSHANDATNFTCLPWCWKSQRGREYRSAMHPCTFCACQTCAGLCINPQRVSSPSQPCMIADGEVLRLLRRRRRGVPSCTATIAESQPLPGQPFPRHWPLFGMPQPLPHDLAATTAGVLVLAAAATPAAAPGPALTISYPVHDREHVVAKSLRSVLRTTAGVWEMVIVLDACTDASEAIVWEELLEYAAAHFPEARRDACACIARRGSGLGAVSCNGDGSDDAGGSCPLGESAGGASRPVSLPLRVVVVRARSPLFETRSDNLVMSWARPASFYALVQSDIILEEVGWNHALARPFATRGDLLATSGRCAFDGNEEVIVGNCAGLGVLDAAEFHANPGFERPVAVGHGGTLYRGNMSGWCFVRDTIVRSPMLLRASHVQALGFLDEYSHYLGGDDVELCARARLRFGWSVGYVLVDAFDSRRDHPRLGSNSSVLHRPPWVRSGRGPRCINAAECTFLDEFHARKRRGLVLADASSNESLIARMAGLGERVAAHARALAAAAAPSSPARHPRSPQSAVPPPRQRGRACFDEAEGAAEAPPIPPEPSMATTPPTRMTRMSAAAEQQLLEELAAVPDAWMRRICEGTA